MASANGSRRRVAELLAELEGLMGRKTKQKKISSKRRPEVVLSDEIESLYEAHANSKICVRKGCQAKWTKRGLCDEHHNELFGQRERVGDEAEAEGKDGSEAKQRFDDECVRDGLVFPRKFTINPFAKKRRELAREQQRKAVKA